MRFFREIFALVLAAVCAATIVGAFYLWGIVTDDSPGSDGCRRIQVVATAATFARDIGISDEAAMDFVTARIKPDDQFIIKAVVLMAYHSTLSIPAMYKRSGDACHDLVDAIRNGATSN